ncbi:MAG: exo-alpha-sialidase, partial [Ilumatobacteraceae bacterium]|nr:exo-alpha-sialidase [Ilumatobacteraceae bacterium]
MRKRLTAALAVATLVLVPSAIAFASYTWTDVDGSTGNWYSMAVSDGGLVAYSSQHRLAGPTVGQGRIWKTADGGVSWSEIMTSPTYANWPHVATSGSGNVVAGIGFALGSSYTTIQISSDAGTTWSPATAAGNLQWTGVALSQNGSIVYATSKNTTGTDGSVKKSIDGGTTWTNVTPEFGGFLLNGGSWTGVATSSDGSRV